MLVRSPAKYESTASLFEEQAPDACARQPGLIEAERVLLETADYVYAHTALKPMSKTLFLISRCLCVAKLGGKAVTANELPNKYREIRARLSGAAPGDDFDFATVIAQCEHHVTRVLDAIKEVCALTDGTDSLGLVFNTLLRGKFEGGEGMGTFLTPEEVVFPMVDMLLKVVDKATLNRICTPTPSLYGDVCGGTGRFVYALARRLEALGIPRDSLANAARLFDQSLMAVDLAKLNFLFEGMQPIFERVGDSLTAPQVTALKERFALLATNPPFGANKYRWNKDLAESLPYQILVAVGTRSCSDTADPAALFFFRNLDLLGPGGALAIVMPDGVVQSDGFNKALRIYERVRNTHLHLAAIVSLPPATFALGGTVAKTSFLIVRKQNKRENQPLYAAVARHVGFVKRGNRRANDPGGNDLVKIADQFGAKHPALGQTVECWRAHDSLVTTRLLHLKQNGSLLQSQTRLGDVVEMARQFHFDRPERMHARFHVSVLDVDSTGLIDIIAASVNEPMSKGLVCKPGDILVSCMNPRIWRVAVVPPVAGFWSCSPEFVVLRPKRPDDAWRIALTLHHPTVMQEIQAMAKGTSSSRQRVPKDRILSVGVPKIEIPDTLRDYVAWRQEFYQKRVREACAFRSLHERGGGFFW